MLEEVMSFFIITKLGILFSALDMVIYMIYTRFYLEFIYWHGSPFIIEGYY
jgi:hypothetical protein